MKTKIVAGLIAIVTIVAVVIFAGCIEEKTPASTPPPKQLVQRFQNNTTTFI